MEYHLFMEKFCFSLKEKETKIIELLQECFKLNKFYFYSDEYIVNYDNY